MKCKVFEKLCSFLKILILIFLILFIAVITYWTINIIYVAFKPIHIILAEIENKKQNLIVILEKYVVFEKLCSSVYVYGIKYSIDTKSYVFL